MKVISLFAGCGGLDLGFNQAGFEVVWANEYDKSIWETYEKNHPHTKLDKRSITDIPSSEIPDADGIIGGPPCQSWSEAWAKRGLADKRGQLFFEFIRVLKDKQPKFFLAENVSWILLPTHKEAVEAIKQEFQNAGYTLQMNLLNASDYWVPQDRKRVFFIGIRNDLDINYVFPESIKWTKTLKDAIGDLPEATPAKTGNKKNDNLPIKNHEYMTGGFSTIFMSRNRVREWNEPSFTIQAWGRHAPIHPKAPKMLFVEQNKRIFVPWEEHLYRRLSIRECWRIQTFPDSFEWHYTSVADWYKMIGNAVPVQLWFVMAQSLKKAFSQGKENAFQYTSKIIHQEENNLQPV